MHLSDLPHIPKASALSSSSCTSGAIHRCCFCKTCPVPASASSLKETKGRNRIEMKASLKDCFTLSKLKNKIQYWCNGGEVVITVV